MADLTHSAVNKHFGKGPVLHDINLDVLHCEFVDILRQFVVENQFSLGHCWA